MTRIRQQNLTAAQWSSNGEALGTVDLTEEENNPFGANVFSPAVQKDRLSEGHVQEAAGDARHRRGARHRRSPTRSPRR